MKCIPAKLAALLLLCASPLRADTGVHSFAVPPVSLDRALSIVAAQANVDIGGALSGLKRVATAGVSGRMSTAAALARLLAGTGYQAVPAGPSAFRIIRRPAVPSQPEKVSSGIAATHRLAPGSAVHPAEVILITANKRESSRLRFPGSVVTLASQFGRLGRPTSAEGVGDLPGVLPILQSTELGSGRNKLFIRGIADSSFAGPTQNTTTIYFGDVPLGYSGPDPNLSLYDIGKVEILEGPQGTLYGAGPIGGVIRLTPNPPNLSRLESRATAGVTATEHGALGGDVAGLVNLPIVADHLALRASGYVVGTGGYISDVGRGLKHINRTSTRGGRADIGVAPVSGWSVDAGLVYQTIHAPDSQYAQRSSPGLSRASLLAQPFDDEFLLAHVAATRQWASGLRLVWASGWSSHERDETFDASGPTARAAAYEAANTSHLLSQEVRLSRSFESGASWVAGFSFLKDKDEIRRMIGPPQSLSEIVGVTVRTVDAALFGEATFVAAKNLLLTGGARLTRARTDSSATIRPRNNDYVPGRTTFRADPTFGLNWLVGPRLALFARYQTGFRTGGLSVAPGIGRVEDFRPDKVRVGETGIRMEREGPLGLAGSAALSYARWSDIQADLIDRRGLPYTTNIGSGQLLGLEVMGDCIPMEGLRLSASAFISHSRLTSSEIPFHAGELPDTPGISATGGITYQRPFAGGTLGADANIRYVGRSYIGARPFLRLRQGGYVDDSFAIEWRRARLGVSVSVQNLANTRGDRFAIGNPFELAAHDQYTPLRPRSVRLGVDFGL